MQVADFFARLVQRVAPKHYAQAMAEVTVTRLFLENFSGDQVCGLRHLGRAFHHIVGCDIGPLIALELVAALS